MVFKILTWNINGLRSFKQTLKVFLDDLHAEIICLQETKITRDMLTEDLAIVEGYSSYFAFSQRRSGYSGVATYAKNCCLPVFATEGLCGTLPSSISACSALPSKEAMDNGINQVLSDIIQAATCELHGAMERSELRELDCEGRAVITIHNIALNSPCATQTTTKHLAIINVYCPRADPAREDRALYKLQFYRALRYRAFLLRDAGAAVVVLGDINTSHRLLDHCDPDVDFHLSPSRNFLDEFLLKLQVIGGEDAVERLKLESSFSQSNSDKKEIVSEQFSNVEAVKRKTDDHDSSVNDCEFAEISTTTSSSSREPHECFQMVDTFRYFYPHLKDAFTCWNTKANARETNYGTRIDYIFCDEDFLPYVKDSLILQDVMGSDHCPVVDIVDGEPVPAKVTPDYCTKNFAEFQGQQQKLWSYFQKKGIPGKECVAGDKNVRQCEMLPDVYSSNELLVYDLYSKSFNPKGSLRNFIVKNVKNTESASGSRSASKVVKTTPRTKGTVNSMKKSVNSGIHCSKRQQSNLLAYFGTKKSEDNKCTNETQPMQRSATNKSLYESELLFLKSNPALYEKLTSTVNGLVDMEVFTKASQSSKSDSSIVTSVKCQNSDDEHLEYSETDVSVNTENPSRCKDQNESPSQFPTSEVQDMASSDIITDQEHRNKPPISSQSKNWAFMNQKLEVPLCSGHREPCVLRTTKKKGPHFNRRFFTCCRGVGRPGQKDAQCGYFKWI